MKIELCEENKQTLAANYSANKFHIKAARGVIEWTDRFKGQTIIVCGAGPSLDQAMPLLAETRHPIIACDRAARPLLAAGIVPFCAVAVEMHAVGARKFDGACGLRAVPLVFDPLCATQTIEEYPGPKYTYNRDRLVQNYGTIRIGTGVITSAVGVAELLGASKIVLAGADLSYPDGKPHASGATVIDEKFIDWLYVLSVDGAQVLSNIYHLANIDELSEVRGGALIQTSRHGAMIPGARHMPLEEALR